MASICSLLDYNLPLSGMNDQIEMKLNFFKWIFHLIEISEVLTGKNLDQQIGVNFYYLLYRSLHSLSQIVPEKDELSLITFLLNKLRNTLPSAFVDSVGVPFCAFSSIMYFLQDPNSEFLSAENVQAANTICLNSRIPMNLPLLLVLLEPEPPLFRQLLTFFASCSISINQKIVVEGENLEKLSNMSKIRPSAYSPIQRTRQICKSFKEEGKSIEVTPLSLACFLNLYDHCKILIDAGALPETV